MTQVSSDTILLLKGVMAQVKDSHRVSFNGNLPEDAESADKMRMSGFFDGFHRPPTGLNSPPKGKMHSHISRLVAGRVAADLVGFAVAKSALPYQIRAASYNTIVEAMQNTTSHARARAPRLFHADPERRASDSQEKWLASVYCDDRTSTFTFIDLGVGIGASARAKGPVRAVAKRLGLHDGRLLLEGLFSGAIGSRTREPGRGQGLPRMRQDAEMGLLPDLEVLTNAVSGNVARGQYRQLRVGFVGTLLRWRVPHDRQLTAKAGNDD